jgi:hypothetical protein
MTMRRRGYTADVETGYYIHADHRIFGPDGRTPWWAVLQGGVEIV